MHGCSVCAFGADVRDGLESAASTRVGRYPKLAGAWGIERSGVVPSQYCEKVTKRLEVEIQKGTQSINSCTCWLDFPFQVV